MTVHMLTTVDNPYNPFTQFDEWNQFDESSGYYTAQYLARITITSHDLSEADESAAIESAIDEAVKENINGMYRKVEAPVGWEDEERVA
jgi:hypothetical protein